MARRLSAQERRQQLIRVGRKVFATNGYEGTTVEEIARRAKVSKPIVYEHFGGKEGLYAVVVDRSMADLTERIIGAIQRGTPRQRVEGAALAFMTWVKDEPDGFMVLLRDKPNSRAGGMAGLMHDLADHVSDVFAEQFVASGYDRRMAGLYASQNSAENPLFSGVFLIKYLFLCRQDRSAMLGSRHLNIY